MNQEQFDDFSIEEKIIALLLDKKELYTGEIAKGCGFTDETGKYRSIRPSLTKLKEKEYLDYNTKETHKPGALPIYYSIKPELVNIVRLYNKCERVKQQQYFQNSTWLIELLIEQNLKIDKPSKELKEDMARMLRASQIFFKTFLFNEYSEKELRELSALVYYPVPDDTCFTEPRFFQEGVDEQPSTDVSYLLYHLFSFCIFAEFLYLNPKNQLDEKIKALLIEMSDKATDYQNAAQKNNETFYILDVLLAFWTVLKDNQTQKIEVLDKLFTEYIKVRDVYWSIGRRDQQLALELNKKYNMIAEILNLPKRDRID